MKNSVKFKFVRKLSSLLATLCIGSGITFGNLDDPSGDPIKMEEILKSWNSKIGTYIENRRQGISQNIVAVQRIITRDCDQKVDDFDQKNGIDGFSIFSKVLDKYNEQFGDLSTSNPKNCRVYSAVALKNLEDAKIKSGFVHIGYYYNGEKWVAYNVLLYVLKSADNNDDRLFVADLHNHAHLVLIKSYFKENMKKIKDIYQIMQTAKRDKQINELKSDLANVKKAILALYGDKCTAALNLIAKKAEAGTLTDDDIEKNSNSLAQRLILRGQKKERMKIDPTYGFLKIDAIDYFVHGLKNRPECTIPDGLCCNGNCKIYRGPYNILKYPNGNRETAPVLSNYLWESYPQQMKAARDTSSENKEDFDFALPKLTYISTSQDWGNCFGKQMFIEWDDCIVENTGKGFGIPREPVI